VYDLIVLAGIVTCVCAGRREIGGAQWLDRPSCAGESNFFRMFLMQKIVLSIEMFSESR
jgi:hypothetical protein